MSASVHRNGSIRKLLPVELADFRDHLLRLDRESRRMRFGHIVSDKFLIDYAALLEVSECVPYIYVENGGIHASAELRKINSNWDQDAEVAFSVEGAYQNIGIGSRLMKYIMRAARNRGVRRVYMSCLPENQKMRAIALKYDAQIRFTDGDLMGEIMPSHPDQLSIAGEIVDDRIGFLLAELDLSARSDRAA
ncbi:MAG: GNAT family N-acetyltransferase [Hyphomicrobiaceae bacterium]